MQLHLIDQLAQWQILLWKWQEPMTACAAMVSESVRKVRRDNGSVELPRQSTADAFEQAVEMVDRFQRLYLRTLRALQDLLKGGTVHIRHAGQVNHAQRQVNLNGRPQAVGRTG